MSLYIKLLVLSSKKTRFCVLGLTQKKLLMLRCTHVLFSCGLQENGDANGDTNGDTCMGTSLAGRPCFACDLSYGPDILMHCYFVKSKVGEDISQR
jgi:hypothetical protein